YLKAKEASDELTTRGRFFAQETIADGNVSALGHIRRFVKKTAGHLHGFLETLSDATDIFLAAEVGREIAHNGKQGIFPPLQNDFSISVALVGAAAAAAISQQVDYEVDAVTRIAEGKFVGPHPEEMQKLVGAFQDAHLDKEEFIRQALALRGVVFSEEHNAHALCENRVEEIRAAFNEAGKTCEPKRLVLVYREQVQPAADRLTTEANAVTARPEELRAVPA
ncbi:MAG TPA: hypothetical protein PLF01_02855, partial [Alphaproteobacteria bacterium]|nr:hypothetical protein [Alphaproteobacteria bacterium]